MQAWGAQPLQAYGGQAQTLTPIMTQPHQRQLWGGNQAMPTIQSQIAPAPIYSPAQTQAGVNQAMAFGHQAAFGVPGLSMPGMAASSPALQSRAAGAGASGLANALNQAEMLRLRDRAANVQNVLGGQLARGTGVLGRAGSRVTMNQTNRRYASLMGRILLEAMRGRIGGIGKMLGEGLQDRAFWSGLKRRGQAARGGHLADLGGMFSRLTGLDQGPMMDALYW